jgi:type IV secretion system protein VirD4
MLDEFPALGRLDFFESALAYMAGYGLRAFLIAQSLNQIDKAYGPNHAILDNCHVRVAFATNDERTAKRISDALGTATELRAQRNYAGHRLAPWLGHLMVSRQESARPLLTPGEVMQLPPDDEIVMVSGCRPIRAKKLRYHQDRNFMMRVLLPPTLGDANYLDRPSLRPDDWSSLGPITTDLFTSGNEQAHATQEKDQGGLGLYPEIGGLRSPPTPAPHQRPLFEQATLNESTWSSRPADRRLERTARIAALDPDDGIPL